MGPGHLLLVSATSTAACASIVQHQRMYLAALLLPVQHLYPPPPPAPPPAGTTKVQLHSAVFRDSSQPPASSRPSRAAHHDPGIILAAWKPDNSWADDELLRLYCVHGALEAAASVYEHIEVVAHPVVVHLTYALATALQEYFQLREEDAGAARQVGGQWWSGAVVEWCSGVGVCMLVLLAPLCGRGGHATPALAC